ncbi:hypothetical protein JB92DRAFT_2710020 [Gautieria morchelliformis]|nr:hypothetical protein JB92DRAFT_2710020 [Gautieria morchelliformis]
MAPAISNPQLTDRVYTLEMDKPWAFLKVKSRGTKHTSFPMFIQGEPITGTVELSLEKTSHIQAVTVEASVSFAVGQETLQFLKKEITLWSTSMGDPRTGNAGIGSPKLKGDYVWPFSIALPDTVATSAVKRGPLSVYPLPPSSEGSSPSCYIKYKVVATIHRGRLRVDHSLSTTIKYLPRSRPSAPSVLRQLAYREHTALSGPRVDPEGWEILPLGVFGGGDVKAACLFALAKPLCYTLGTSIPFWLTLHCFRGYVLDVSVRRGPLFIHLVRDIFTGPDATDEAKATLTVGKGIYWSSGDDNDTSDTRNFVGEIPLTDSLVPSFVFPHVTIRVSQPFYYLAGSTMTALTQYQVVVSFNMALPLYFPEVEIATDLAPGPIPRCRVPATHREHQEIIR